MNFITALIYQARILGEDRAINLGRPEDAVPLLERSFSMADGFVHQDPRDQNSRERLAAAGLGLADILRHSDSRRALAIYDHTQRHLAEIGDNPGFRELEVSALVGSTYSLRRLGRTAEVRPRLDAAFELLRQIKAYPAGKVKPGSEPDVALCALADYEAANGNISAAIGIYQKLLDQIQAWQPKPETNLSNAVDLSRIYTAVAGLNRLAGRYERASDLEAWRLELWEHWDAKLPKNSFVRRQLAAAQGPANHGVFSPAAFMR